MSNPYEAPKTEHAPTKPRRKNGEVQQQLRKLAIWVSSSAAGIAITIFGTTFLYLPRTADTFQVAAKITAIITGYASVAILVFWAAAWAFTALFVKR